MHVKRSNNFLNSLKREKQTIKWHYVACKNKQQCLNIIEREKLTIKIDVKYVKAIPGKNTALYKTKTGHFLFAIICFRSQCISKKLSIYV